MRIVTSHDLLDAGIPGGPYFVALREEANDLAVAHGKEEALRMAVAKYHAEYEKKTIPLNPTPPSLRVNIEAETEEERLNLDAVVDSMNEAAQTPTVRELTVLPDACVSGPKGTITVGGVIATENAIHPGMHSSDICCSMMATNLGKADPKAVLSAALNNVRFGPFAKNGGRLTPPESLMRDFARNPFMSNPRIMFKAEEQLGTQGDGNHFYYVGVSEKTGDTFLVSHHGSRGVGGTLYTLGMKTAIRFTSQHSPETLTSNSWIEADSEDGVAYWEALQLAREWTRLNHSMVHDLIQRECGAETQDRFWNEHNFVFRRNDLYYHAKGATPAWRGFSHDADPEGRTIIPLNMAQPILIVRGRDNPNSLGFSPHGAGRNLSRMAHKRKKAGRSAEEVMAEETNGLHVHFQSGTPDISELPSAYKNADSVVSQIESMGLADLLDRILPYGSIMAGEIDLPWKRSRSSTKS